ncbi:MAG: hypothetical protein IPI27_18445 [Betaproteobacteria bacterium]|nr:hypothetical protein [Betaproteobacteria bacterium]
MASRHLRFQQFLFGYPVYDAQVSVHEDLNGRVSQMHGSDIRKRRQGGCGRDEDPRDGAEAIARAAIREPGADAPAGSPSGVARQVWYALTDGRLVLAWEILITAERPLLDYRFIVDRASGEVLLREDRLLGWVIGRGKVFRPNPIQGVGRSVPDRGQRRRLHQQPDRKRGPAGPGGGHGKTPGQVRGRELAVHLPAAVRLPDCRRARPAVRLRRDGSALRAGECLLRHRLGAAVPEVARLRRRTHGAQRHPRLSDQGLSAVGQHGQLQVFAVRGHPLLRRGRSPGRRGRRHRGARVRARDTVLPESAWGCLSGTQCEMRAMGEGSPTISPPSSTQVAAIRATRMSTPHASGSGTAPPTPTRLRRSPIHPVCGEWTAARSIRPTWSAGYTTTARSGRARCGISGTRSAATSRRRSSSSTNTRSRRVRPCPRPRWRWSPSTPICSAASTDSLAPGLLCPRHPGRGRLRAADEHDDHPACNQGHVGSPINPTRNEGQSPWLRLKGGVGTTTRLVLGFDLSGINLNDVKSAILKMTIAGTDQQWDVFGRTIDAHALVADFDEGNGIQIGADPSLMTLGTGTGATWKCPNDADISNSQTECMFFWDGGSAPGTPFPHGTPTPPAVQTSVMVNGRSRWTVTGRVWKRASRNCFSMSVRPRPARRRCSTPVTPRAQRC